MTEVEGDFQKADANLARALTRAGDCAAAYREANDRLRRQFNMAFFKRLLLSDEGEVTGELASPFDVILGEELRRATVSQAKHELGEASTRRCGSGPTSWPKTTSAHKSQIWLLRALDLQPLRGVEV